MFKKIGLINGVELSDMQVYFSGETEISKILAKCVASEKVALSILKKLRNDKVLIEKEYAGHKSQYTVKKEEKRDALDFRSEGDLFQLAKIDKMIDIVIDFSDFNESVSGLHESEVLAAIADFMENNLYYTFPDETVNKIINCDLTQEEVLFILEKAKYDAKSELAGHQGNFRTRGDELITLKFKAFGDKCHIQALEALMNKVIVAYKN